MTKAVVGETVRGARAAMRRSGFTIEDLKAMKPHQRQAAARRILRDRDHRDRMARQRSKRAKLISQKEHAQSMRAMLADRQVAVDDQEVLMILMALSVEDAGQ